MRRNGGWREGAEHTFVALKQFFLETHPFMKGSMAPTAQRKARTIVL